MPANYLIVISFCCLFILATCQTFTSCIPNIPDYLDNVTEAAQLLIDLAINADHKPRAQGTFIMKKVESLRSALQNVKNNDIRTSFEVPEGTDDSFNPDSAGLAFEGMESWFTDNNFFDMEPIWHFPRLIPDA